MDDFDVNDDGSSSSSDGTDGFFVLVIHVVVGVIIYYSYRYFCAGRAPTSKSTSKKSKGKSGDEVTVDASCLQPKKQLLTSYLLLFIGGGLGAHHFYLDRIVHGIVCVFTFNFCCIGWVWDFIFMYRYVREFNARRCAPNAPYDSSRRPLLWVLPTRLLGVVGVLVYLALYGPWILHKTGVVDIDRLAAQTEVNPYELLGLGRGAGLAEAKAAYRKESLRWHPDRNIGCGKECTDRMSEIAKAFDLIKRRRAPQPAGEDENAWEKWLTNIGTDWQHVITALTAEK